MISGLQLKREFAACAIGMDLPAGHELRGKLAAKKVVYENLLEVLLGFIIWGPLSSMNN